MRLIASVPVGSAVLQGHAGLGVVALRFHWEVKSTGHVARTFAVGGSTHPLSLMILPACWSGH